jgi:hypothetical protein
MLFGLFCKLPALEPLSAKSLESVFELLVDDEALRD